MTDDMPQITTPTPVTDVPIIKSRPGPESRQMKALWPLRNIHDEHNGPGVQYAVLTVAHDRDRKLYYATLNREDHFATVTAVQPFDAVRVGTPVRTGRFSQTSLQAAFDQALRTLRSEIAEGNEKLAAFFTPTGADDR